FRQRRSVGHAVARPCFVAVGAAQRLRGRTHHSQRSLCWRRPATGAPGIPAVIAMQFEITDKAAILLAKEFYDALADGYPVDGALAEARKSIFTAENDIEWGTPVLYLRSVDG